MLLRLTDQKSVTVLVVCLMIAVIMSTLLPYGDSKFIRLKKKKIKLATQAASALVLLRKPKKVVFPLPLPVPLPFPIITKHDPVIHPIDPLQYLAFEKGLMLSGLGGLPGGFSTHGKRNCVIEDCLNPNQFRFWRTPESRISFKMYTKLFTVI